MYTQFIDGLARALKRAGLGIAVAGRRVPLLMYADDVVMLAGSQAKLARVNAVATTFACTHRFEFNTAKSAVMAFGAKRSALAAARARKWTLGGVVKLVSYVYLGVITNTSPLPWSHT